MFLLAATASAQTYRNPILYADYSDPDVIRVDTHYYLVASSFHFSPGLPVLKSEDLVHWTIIAHVLPRLNFSPAYDMPGPFTIDDTGGKSKQPAGDEQRYGGGVWAPAIRYRNGLFYVYWPTPKEGIFMATAKDPAGPWSEPMTLLAGKGYEDPCPFWDDDGQAYLIHSKTGAGPLILHRMSVDGTKLLDDGKVIVEDKQHLPTLEGPKLYKRNGWYYILAPFGGVPNGSQAALRSRNIWGPYESKVVLAKGTTDVNGPHQGGYVETPSGEGWFVHFNSTGAFGRIDYLEPVRWEDDWPVMGDNGQPVLEHAAPDTGAWRPEDRLQDSDEFSSTTLGLQWSWNHNPDDTRWSLSARPGFLRLTAEPAEHLVNARNTLTQILQGPQSTITARFDVSKMVDAQRAGLVLFGTKPVWLGAVRDNGQTHLTFSSAGAETAGPALTADTVEIRAEVTPDATVRFAYSLDGKAFTSFGDATQIEKLSWWKGWRPGLFTYIKAASDAKVATGYVDVDWVHVSREAR